MAQNRGPLAILFPCAAVWLGVGMNKRAPLASQMEKAAMARDASDAEDIEKVREFLAGDPRAFEFLFDKYREKVFGVAYRFVNNKEDALEITQEVFLRVHQGVSKFKTDSKFFTWLYRITANRAIDFLRGRKARPTAELSLETSGSGGDAEGHGLADALAHPRSDDPADVYERKEMAGQLMNAVSQLSSKHQTVFLLHAVEQLSYKEIAEVVGCSIGTVMSRLFYARKKLQQYMLQCGYL